jgi:hypothetical protein
MSTGKRRLAAVDLKPPVPDSDSYEEKDKADDMELRQAVDAWVSAADPAANPGSAESAQSSAGTSDVRECKVLKSEPPTHAAKPTFGELVLSDMPKRSSAGPSDVAANPHDQALPVDDFHWHHSAAAEQRDASDQHRRKLDLKYKKRAWKRMRREQGLSEELPPNLMEMSWQDLLARGEPGSASATQQPGSAR